MKPFIVIAEDEQAVSELLRYNLEAEGYDTAIANDGDEAMLLLDERVPDLMLLDWMLPKISGIEICRRVRARQETANLPIIMLTARTEEADRIRGLETGADDYVTKPFSTNELMARVKAVLRRIRPALMDDKIAVGDIQIDRSTHRVTRAGKDIHLGTTEFRLLEYLMRHAGQVVTRTMLLENVWDYHFDPQTNVIDVQISRLRSKIDKDFNQSMLQTVRGAGYRLNAGD